jgi:ketosteroid isomerase-like protein
MPRFAALAFFGLLSTAAALPAQSSTARRAEVLAFVRAYTDANNRADVTAMLDMTSHSPGVSSVGNGEIIRGWEAIRKDTDDLVGKEGLFHIDVGSMDVTMLGSSNALVVAPVTLTVATQRGPVQIAGAMTLVLEKSAKGWLLLNETYSIKSGE